MRVKFLSEFFGTLFLAMIVLGSGIMGQNLFPGQVGLILLANSIATGAGLFVLIMTLGNLSGAHMNPAVSFVEYLRNNLKGSEFFFYSLAQILGAWVGVVLTHLMFRHQIFEISQVSRPGAHLWISELIATFGLICVIALSEAKNVQRLPLLVAAYITSAYWFTSSTSFANPALTFARMFTNSFGGMAPEHFLAFLLSQVSGAVLGYFLSQQVVRMHHD